MVSVRLAEITDVPQITRIYNQGIADRDATLEADQKTAEERKVWFMARDARHPVLVSEIDGSIVGFASINVFNARKAYDRVADLSIYIDRSLRGKGVGSALMDALVKKAVELGYHKMVLVVFSRNEQAKALYRKFGFREVGVYKEQGMIDGQWIDLLIMERILQGPLSVSK